MFLWTLSRVINSFITCINSFITCDKALRGTLCNSTETLKSLYLHLLAIDDIDATTQVFLRHLDTAQIVNRISTLLVSDGKALHGIRILVGKDNLDVGGSGSNKRGGHLQVSMLPGQACGCLDYSEVELIIGLGTKQEVARLALGGSHRASRELL